MQSALVHHDYRSRKEHLAPAELSIKRTERSPRMVILHTEVVRNRNYKLEETEKFMAPFLPMAKLKRCIGCGVDVKARGNHRICANCRKLMSVVASVKSWMRSYIETGYDKYLQNAAAQIRRYRLEPEDLRWL